MTQPTTLKDYYEVYQAPKLDICKDTPFYFAYGMNTDPDQMMLRTGMPLAIGRAMVRDHAFRFAHFADVYPCEGTNTVGVLWELNNDQFASLDAREGYPYYYDRKIVEVESGGKIYRAWMYFMTPGHDTYEPSKSYYDMLVRGYTTFNVDLTQIEVALKQATVASVVSKLTVDQYKQQRQTIAYQTAWTPVKTSARRSRKATKVFKDYTAMLLAGTSKREYRLIKEEAKRDGLSLETLAREYIEAGWVGVPDHWIVQSYTKQAKYF